MDDVHVLTTVVENGGSIEITLVAHAVTAAQQFRTLLDGMCHLGSDALQGTSLNKRSHIHTVVLTRITHLHRFHLLNKDFGECILHLLLNIDTLRVVAYLTIITDAAVHNPLRSLLQVGILAHNRRGFSTQLKRHFRNVFRSGGHNALTG